MTRAGKRGSSSPPELTPAHEELAIITEPGLVLVACTADPGLPRRRTAPPARLLAKITAAPAPRVSSQNNRRPQLLPSDEG